MDKKGEIEKLKEENTRLKEELEEKTKQVEEYLNSLKRARADFINREKEWEKEKKEIIHFANIELILKLLPLFDTLEKSVKMIKEENPWTKGMINFKRELENIFKQINLERIETKNKFFDPLFHEAVKKKKSNKESGLILEELQSGWMLNKKVIRPAKVIISE